jgi:two-component system C4-dicarboxylate transport response regulator DctD
LLSERSQAPVPLAEQVGALNAPSSSRSCAGRRQRHGGQPALGVPKQTLYYKLQKYGLTADGYKN